MEMRRSSQAHSLIAIAREVGWNGSPVVITSVGLKQHSASQGIVSHSPKTGRRKIRAAQRGKCAGVETSVKRSQKKEVKPIATPSRADFVDLSTAPSTPKITAHDGNPKASERIEGAEGQEDGESLSSSKVRSPLRLRLA